MNRILGIGIDLVELDRLARGLDRYGQRLVDRLFRPTEVKERRGGALVRHLGGLFAAKEAVLKALGTGWGQGLGFRQVEVVGGPGRAPGVRLHDRAAELARTMGVETIHLSITHERHYAIAFAIAEGSTRTTGERSGTDADV